MTKHSLIGPIREFGVMLMLCPECVQGKPWNCTGETLDENDNFIECDTAFKNRYKGGKQ